MRIGCAGVWVFVSVGVGAWSCSCVPGTKRLVVAAGRHTALVRVSDIKMSGEKCVNVSVILNACQ